MVVCTAPEAYDLSVHHITQQLIQSIDNWPSFPNMSGFILSRSARAAHGTQPLDAVSVLNKSAKRRRVGDRPCVPLAHSAFFCSDVMRCNTGSRSLSQHQ